MIKRIGLVVVLAWFIGTSTQAQEKIDSILFELEDQFPQEKVHLHIDRDYYSPGETIWFKAYILADRQPAAFSRTCYVDLIDDKGRVLNQKILPVLESSAASGIDIPNNYGQRKVFLRAYTRWMQEIDESLIPLRSVYVNQVKPVAGEKFNPIPQLLFYPEGGEWVAGLETTVAFRASYNNGEPASIQGAVVDSKGKKLADFKTVHYGMGTFTAIPQAGETYKAIWKDKSGKQQETILPTVQAEGLVLQVTNEDNQLRYTLRRSNTPRLMNLYVVAQAQQQMQYSARINLSNKTEVTAPINTDSIPDGVVQITVFDSQRQPVAERIVFINRNNYYFITDVSMAEKSFTKRTRNVLIVAVSDTIRSNLSVSVTDLALNTQTPSTHSIYSSMLLTQDVKDHVYNPDYYFTSTSDSLTIHTDLVMRTSGWRRFNWTKLITSGMPTVKALPQQYLSVQGKIVGLNATQLAGKSVNLMVNTGPKSNNLVVLPVSRDGQFEVNELYFFDTARIYYQFNNDKDRRLTSQASFQFISDLVKRRDLQANELAAANPLAITDTNALKKQAQLAAIHISNLSKVKELDVVTVKAKTKSANQKLEEQYVSGMFSGGDGFLFNLADDPMGQAAFNILTYLQGKVAGLQINATGTGSATWRGTPTSFFVNEMPVDIGMLQNINIQDVALIKVLRPPFIGAPGGGGGGAVAIYTKSGSITSNDFKALNYATIQGYSSIREFKPVDYSEGKTDIADYRPTLLWQPYVLTDKLTKKIYLPFYNNDQAKAFRVVIEGINEQGKLTREERIIR
jgi:hypothetical protein